MKYVAQNLAFPYPCTLILAALTTGMAFCHTLELPAKLQYDYSLYLAVQHSLYWLFGSLGAVIEVGAVVAAWVLPFLVRQRWPTFGWTVAGATFLALALAAWFALVAPMNAHMAQWTVDAAPPDWLQVRLQWEYGHATHFVLQLCGFSLLVLSVLLDTPTLTDHPRASTPKLSRSAWRSDLRVRLK